MLGDDDGCLDGVALGTADGVSVGTADGVLLGTAEGRVDSGHGYGSDIA